MLRAKTEFKVSKNRSLSKAHRLAPNPRQNPNRDHLSGIALGSGIGDVLVSKSRLRLMELAGKNPKIDSTPSSSAGELLTTTNPSAASTRSSLPLSVTEGTTRHLEDLKVEK